MEVGKESDKVLTAMADADYAFEPSIDELVNDFDDEQTLREEEALAAIENPLNNPLDEIEALKEESEMPLEELLAKYALPPGPALHANVERKRKRKKTSSGGKKHKNKTKSTKSNHELATEKPSVANERIEPAGYESPVEEVNMQPEIIIIESGDDEEMKEEIMCSEENELESRLNEDMLEERVDDEASTVASDQDKPKIRRSHLFELYPDQNFDDAIAAAHGAIALETLYSEDEEEEDIDEDEETDPDYIKKTIMVGSAFQAVIPGLSQYGDVLPYENEDKLVWEPSQVSEAEVEEYLLKVREIKPSLNDDESSQLDDEDMTVTSSEDVILIESDDQQKAQNDIIKSNPSTPVASDIDAGGVVKDNEQALHLLVQCGYDFKEALRRKKLNAVPLTGGSMSLWSEEECQKFEEGIQKFGKDFLKIRQNQVRTRTMRELVQFYYLWKKSERRDHNFANADTVDHMDIYLNEGEDYSTSPGCVSLAAASTIAPLRKLNGCNSNNFSIMTVNIGGSPIKINNGTIVGNKKRTSNDSNASHMHCSGNCKNIIGNNNEQNSIVPTQQQNAASSPIKPK